VKKNTIRNELIRVLWSRDKDQYSVVIIDRLDPRGFKHISASCIRHVDKAYIHVKCRDEEEETLIPLHRVQAILRGGAETWSRYRRS